MTTSAATQSTSRRFNQWFERVVESALNWIFSLKHEAGTYRNNIRWLGLFLFYIFSVTTLYDLEGWLNLFRNFFSVTQENPNQVPIEFGLLLYYTVINPVVLRNLIALLAPYLLIHEFAAIYLADIFEKEVKIANRFLDEAAFATDYFTIRISGGRLLDKHHNSPIVEIGGPGFVIVDMDSALVLERPDGKMRIIPPTAKFPNGRAVIEDFERVRQTIDLRDIINPQEITARSKDGIIVKVRDIQYSYSVYRGPNPRKSLENPYPVDEKAIETLVRDVKASVAPGKTPDRASEWNRPLPGGLFVSVNIEFNNFISRHKLTEFFSAVGPPEEQALEERAQKISQSTSDLAGQSGYKIINIPFKAGKVEYRPGLAEKIFGSPQFANFLAKKGLQVNWIGIGTWETASEITLKNHVKAWELSLQNLKDGNPEKLKEIYDTSRNNKLIQLINELPINTYYRIVGKTEAEIIAILFDEYTNYLSSIEQHFLEHRVTLPDNINNAIGSLKAIRDHYVVGGHYYVCVKTSSRDDANIVDAVCYTIDVAFSTLHLPGYKAYPVSFDFDDKTECTFTFLARIFNNTTLVPDIPQERIMNLDDLYVNASFQVTIPPNGNNILDIEIQESQNTLIPLSLELKP
jgi:hypothetical protein